MVILLTFGFVLSILFTIPVRKCNVLFVNYHLFDGRSSIIVCVFVCNMKLFFINLVLG